VRGDSLRDLYAKALALLGLGLLGAAGALVDYWPVPSALPAVASALLLPADPGLPALRLTATHEIFPTAEFRSSRAKPRASMATDEDLTIPDTNGNDAVFGLREGQPESLGPLADLPPSLAVTPASMAAMPVSTLALIPPPVDAAFEATPENPLSPQPVPPTQNRENRFAGAAKTGAKAVAWTGNAIAKPFVALGHVLHL
jgi:hypothetical protein